MTSRLSFSLVRIIARMADIAGPRHRELMGGMLAELESIPDASERRRFAFGATAAILRLALWRARDRLAPTWHGLPPCPPTMPIPRPGPLLRGLLAPLVITAVSLTTLLLTNFVVRQLPQLTARGASAGTIAELALLGVPFTMALTIPMAVFVAACWLFARLGREGTIEDARNEAGGVRRLVVPVLGAALCVSAITLVTNTQLIPRANTRLLAVMSGRSVEVKSDRMMTNGELRAAARRVREDPGLVPRAQASRMAAAYEVEIHKKYALAMACIFLAMLGAAIGLRFPRGGTWLVVGASVVVFGGYYACLLAGETLADELVLSPFAAMWLANAVLLVITLMLTWRRASHGRSLPGTPA